LRSSGSPVRVFQDESLFNATPDRGEDQIEILESIGSLAAKPRMSEDDVGDELVLRTPTRAVGDEQTPLAEADHQLHRETVEIPQIAEA
jgi:hypothetical protein